MSFFLTVIVGVATGLAASALFWWLQAKLLRPKIFIFPELRLVKAEGEESSANFTCEFKIVNRSRFAAADLSIKANLTVPGLLPDGSRYIFYMRDLTLAWMEPGEDQEYFVWPMYLSRDADQKEYCIKLESLLGKPLEKIGMRELMSSCPGSYVTVYVASNHAFSGARAFKRAKFTENDFIVAAD
jgi:hypothetical protein